MRAKRGATTSTMKRTSVKMENNNKCEEVNNNKHEEESYN